MALRWGRISPSADEFGGRLRNPLAAAIYGILATALIAGGLLLAPVAMNGHLLLGAIVLLALWYGALALLIGTRAIAHR